MRNGTECGLRNSECGMESEEGRSRHRLGKRYWAYRLLRLFGFGNETTFFSLPAFPPSAFHLQPSTFSLPPSAFHLQPSTFSLQPSAIVFFFSLGFHCALPLHLAMVAALFRPVEHVAVRGKLLRPACPVLHDDPAREHQEQDNRACGDVYKRAQHRLNPRARRSP